MELIPGIAGLIVIVLIAYAGRVMYKKVWLGKMKPKILAADWYNFLKRGN
jgi:hypothetical protein